MTIKQVLSIALLASFVGSSWALAEVDYAQLRDEAQAQVQQAQADYDRYFRENGPMDKTTLEAKRRMVEANEAYKEYAKKANAEKN